MPFRYLELIDSTIVAVSVIEQILCIEVFNSSLDIDFFDKHDGKKRVQKKQKINLNSEKSLLIIC